MSATVLVLEDLCIVGPERVLVDHVSLTVQRGRITAVMGPSGSGKSLTARACMGVVDVVPGLKRGVLRYPDRAPDDLFADVRGQGWWAHRRLLRRTATTRGSYITYAAQAASSALNPGRTVGHQLALALKRRAEAPRDVGMTVVRLLEEVGLPAQAGRALPSELSGGMAQRAALAVAIAPEPRVLIADEPETGLDPVLRRAVTERLLEVAEQHGVGLLLISHNEDIVERIAHDVVRLVRPQEALS